MSTLNRHRYAELYGPTVGDRVRLADTELLVQVERDLCGGPGRAGDEAVPGADGVLRESQGQARATRADGTPDTVITGVVVVDHWGVVKADLGIRNGRIAALAKAGNPETMERVHPGLVIGPETEVIDGRGRIVTPGAVDTLTGPLRATTAADALAGGVTTLLGGGASAGAGLDGAVTPGPWHLTRMLRTAEALPVNVGLLGHGSTVSAESLHAQLRAGAAGFVIHPGRGATPTAVDACLTVCDATGVPLTLHTDPWHEAGFTHDTLEAVAGRSVHTSLRADAPTDHLADGLALAGEPYVLPGSTTTGPHGVNAATPSARHAALRAAVDLLHDLGALSVLGSDGRPGDLVRGAWQLADAMRRRRGRLPDDRRADNHRVRRYVAKYTINPALVHGLDREVGSIRTGKLADLVLWDPAFFGVRPWLVIKGGHVVHGPADATGTPARPDPATPGPPAPAGSLLFLAQPALEVGLPDRLGLARPCAAVTHTRDRGKDDLRENTARPHLVTAPDSDVITVDGEPVDPEPATEVPLAQRYALF